MAKKSRQRRGRVAHTLPIDSTFRYLGATEDEIAETDGSTVWGITATGDLEEVDPRILSMVSAERKIPGALRAIHDVTATTNPIRILAQLYLFNAFRRASKSGSVSFGADALVEFYAGYVTSLPAPTVIGALDEPVEPGLVLELDNAVREYGRLALLAQRYKYLTRKSDPRVHIRNLVEMEFLFDRMEGFAPHLRAIANAVLSPLDKMSQAEFGFKLSDAVTVSTECTRLQAEQYSSARRRTEARLAKSNPLRDDVFDAVMENCTPRLHANLPNALALRTGIGEGSIKRMLASMSVCLGGQSVVSLRDENRLRKRPIIDVAGRGMLWGHPNDFDNRVQDWAIDMCRPNPRLIAALDRSRQKAVESLSAETLSALFGTERVSVGVKYDLPGRPDIDILVSVPGLLIVGEVKGGRFTDPAKRGGIDRIQRKRQELIEKAILQNERAWQYIAAGGGRFWGRDGRRVDTPRARHAISLIVTLDRIDPLYSDATRWSATSDRTLPRLVISLADLLLIADVLPAPAEMSAYLRDRAEMASKERTYVATEGDALSLWCAGRRPKWTEYLDETASALRYGGEPLNRQFRGFDASDYDPQVNRVTSGIPRVVLNAMARRMAADDPTWFEIVSELGRVPPAVWDSIMRVINKVTAMDRQPTSRRSRRIAKQLENDGIRLTESLRLVLDRQADERALRVDLLLNRA